MRKLIAGLRRTRERSLDGAAQGVDAKAAQIQTAMRATTAHGDVTGATRAGYSARRVGRGASGAAEHAAAVEAAVDKNPGQVATAPVRIDGVLGMIIDAQTIYQPILEEADTGDRAVLVPTIRDEGEAITRAAADGSRRALR